jgi:DNA-binding response OmpR family regulator
VIDTVVRSLRKKLGERASMIETVRGRGYRLRVEDA